MQVRRSKVSKRDPPRIQCSTSTGSKKSCNQQSRTVREKWSCTTKYSLEVRPANTSVVSGGLPKDARRSMERFGNSYFQPVHRALTIRPTNSKRNFRVAPLTPTPTPPSPSPPPQPAAVWPPNAQAIRTKGVRQRTARPTPCCASTCNTESTASTKAAVFPEPFCAFEHALHPTTHRLCPRSGGGEAFRLKS